MGLTKVKLRQYIELIDLRNSELKYGAESVRGVNTAKQMMPTKADLNNRDLSKFQIVAPEVFFFNHRTSRNGSKFSITYNDTNETIICTEDYVVFKLSEYGKKYILTEWLYMFFNRPEFDRYVITNSWGSSTEFYNWEDLCDVDIELPPLHVQQKYVDIYNAMVANQQCYERGLENLKISIDVLLDRFKHSSKKQPIGDFFEEVDVRNSKNTYSEVSGVNITKQFIPSIANSSDLRKYKIVKTKQFVFSGMQTGRDECIRIALLEKSKPVIVSPAYSVLQIKNDYILPEYVQMWFSRSEMDRLGWFMSDSSIRSNLDLPRFYEIEIPVPTKTEQEEIVKIYYAYTIRRSINERLKAQIKDICPILVKGAVEEGEQI